MKKLIKEGRGICPLVKMPIESQVLATTYPSVISVWLAPKLGILFLAVLYFVFSLIVARQINLMTETLITEAVPILRAFAIIHAGLALGIIILFIGFLFG